MGMDGQGHIQTALLPVKRSGAHCTGGWIGHRTGLKNK